MPAKAGGDADSDDGRLLRTAWPDCMANAAFSELGRGAATLQGPV